MRSPFREPPAVELGTLDVGLDAAARRASARLPRGGRLVDPAARATAPHRVGAVGSLGLFLFAVGVVVARTSGLEPVSARGLLAILTLVGLGGGSLALVLCAVDRAAARPTRRGEVVGRSAASVLRRLARLSLRANEAGERFGARQIGALRRAIAAARRPMLSPFVPEDVVGRAELLLARAIARRAGRSWAEEEARHVEVRALLEAASEHLDDPSPAEADLLVLDEAPHPSRRAMRAARRGSGRVRARRIAEPVAIAPPDEAEDDAVEAEEHALARS